MLNKIIYHTTDKSSWGPGPWQAEPDKVQWTETSLPCLIKRAEHSGCLCGYVGVGPTHPFHGKTGYDEEGNFRVHGGITFNDSCQDMSREAAWEEYKDIWAGVIENYDAWKTIWWFGFDCTYYGDLSPAREVLLPSPSPIRGVYCNLAYVEKNVRDLAKQLKALENSREQV